MRKTILVVAGLMGSIGSIITARVVVGESHELLPRVSGDPYNVDAREGECVSEIHYALRDLRGKGAPAIPPSNSNISSEGAARAAQGKPASEPGYQRYDAPNKSALSPLGRDLVKHVEGGRVVATFEVVEMQTGRWAVAYARAVGVRDSDGACRLSPFNNVRLQDPKPEDEIPPGPSGYVP